MRTRATVFGLDVLADSPIAFLEGALAAPTQRRLELGVCGEEARRAWPATATVICSREHLGMESFRIESHPRCGHLLWGAEGGSHLLSADGTRMRCAPEGLPESSWQRFLVGQALPFAALVAGLEIFHASAVVLGDTAVAFTGPSGAGKTSLALALCDGEASFLADDVLALELRDDTLFAHPGTPLAGVATSEAARRRDLGVLAHGPPLAENAREQVVRVEGMAHAVPLAALFFIERTHDGPLEPLFEPAPEAGMLLGATFNFVLATRARLHRLLEVCALAARGRVERIVAHSQLDASTLARAVERRLSST
jgi:hypothetical protein